MTRTPMAYTLPEFLAHAIALEKEAAERYLELAEMMEAHDNPEPAKVFRDMARFSKMHCNDIAKRARGVDVPQLKSWQFRWRLPPEVGDYAEDGSHFMMTPFNALTYARENEIRGMEYYREVAAKSSDPEVKRLGNEFADEEKGHVEALDRWIAGKHPSAQHQSA